MTDNEFCNHYSDTVDKLTAYAMKLTRNADRSKDLIQETAKQAYVNKHRYQMGTNFKAWITTIMRNTFINNYRKNKKRRNLETPIDKLLFALEGKSVSNSAESSLTQEELYDIIDGLKDKYSRTFLLFYKGYHYDEISEEMDLPIGTVKSRLFQARKELKKRIKAQYGDDHISTM